MASPHLPEPLLDSRKADPSRTQDALRQQRDRFRSLLDRGRGWVHMVGIGGIGMAGLARHLAALGFRVTGSEQAPGETTLWLRAHGISVWADHDEARIEPAIDHVVRTPAAPEHNPEVARAAILGIPVTVRGAALAALAQPRRTVAITGTHGKTTTSAMVLHILARCGGSPGFCIGGELDAFGGVAAPCGDDRLVIEADESDGTLELYEADVAVITNLEFDHVEDAKDETEMLERFRRFTRNARGPTVFCADDPGLARLGDLPPGSFSYGFDPKADVRVSACGLDANSSLFDLDLNGTLLADIRLPVPGLHNVVNAAGAAAAAAAFGAGPEAIRGGVTSFEAVRRRFEWVWNDEDIAIVSDYAHHPTEIRAVIQTARRLGRARLTAIFQPHRYTRTRSLLDQFADSFVGLEDLTLVPVYASSEQPVDGGRSEDLLRAIRRRGDVPVRLSPSLESAWQAVWQGRCRGDLLLLLGAGDVSVIADWAGPHLREFGFEEDIRNRP